MGVKHRDTLGMHRYECKSKLSIWCKTNRRERTCTITIWLEHHKRHPAYYNIALPPEAAEMIRENLDWTTPSDMARKIQLAYPSVSTKQVHKAWTTMSETLWKRNSDQITSAKALLAEYEDDADLLTIPTMDGVKQVAWVMKRIANALRGKIVEIGIDVTCKQ